jgi:hypothetical protein
LQKAAPAGNRTQIKRMKTPRKRSSAASFNGSECSGRVFLQ